MDIFKSSVVMQRIFQVVSFFAITILDGLHLIPTLADSLAQHTSPSASYLLLGITDIISFSQKVVLNAAVVILVFSHMLVFVVTQICGRFHGGDVSPSSDLTDAVHATCTPPLENLQSAVRFQSPPAHHLSAKNVDPNPVSLDHHMGSELVEAEHTESLPANEHYQALPEISSLLQYIGTSLLDRYLKERRDLDLAISIDVLHIAEHLRRSRHLRRPNTLNNLSIALFIRYKRDHNNLDLAKAIALRREADDLERPDHSNSSSPKNFGNMTLAPHDSDYKESDIPKTLVVRQEALNVQPPRQPGPSPSNERANSSERQAFLYIEHYQRECTPALLAESINLFQQVLELRPPGGPDRIGSLGNLADALIMRFKQSSRDSDLMEIIRLYREVLTLHPPDHPTRPTSLEKYANSIYIWYKRHGGDSALSMVIELRKEALILRPPSHPDRPNSLRNLGTAILRRYEQGGAERDLTDSTELFREALALQPVGHPDRPSSLNNLANAIHRRYERHGTASVLSEVIDLHGDVLILRPPGHPHRSSSLGNLGAVILERYGWGGDERDLTDATELLREALALQPAGHPDRPSSLNNLANAIHRRHDRYGGDSDLSQVIELHREGLYPPGHPSRSTTLINLASAIITRYDQGGNGTDLSEAIAMFREALTLRPRGHPGRSTSLNNLAAAIATRYERYGGEHDLWEEIELHREALALHPPHHHHRSTSLNNLAGAIRTRYERDGGGSDLSEVIELQREALTLRPPGHPNRSDSLSNLGSSILRRHERDGGEADLSEGIKLLREAHTFYPSGHPRHSSSLNNLAGAILTCYNRYGGRWNLLEVIKLHSEALALRSPGHPDRSRSLGSLASAYRLKFFQDKKVSDILSAMRYQREAFDAQPAESPFWSNVAYKLALDLFGRVLVAGISATSASDLALREEVIQLVRGAIAAKTSVPSHRFQAALGWIEISVAIDPNSVLEAYQSAFVHLGRVLSLGQSLHARHNNLLSQSLPSRPTKSLALDAARWALASASESSTLAIELLDQGRNVLLTSVGRFRADLSEVRQQDLALADGFYRTSRALEGTILKGEEISERRSPHEDPISRYKRVSFEWEDIVAKIRLLPNCESFLLPVPYIKLQEAAVDGPVVVIVVDKERSTAIIVMHKGEPHTVDLPAASEEALKTLHREMGDELRAPVRPDVRDVLSDLWKIVVQPIIHELQDVLLIPTGSRIWWYPTSWASFLPLHAAGSYTKGGLNVPNLYISSYTPTLQALRQSRHRLSTRSDRTISPLIVSQAQTPGQAVLPSVEDEVGIVFSLVPDAFLLSDDQGTKFNVLKKLHDHSWLHLACHGVPDPSDPFNSHFALHDGPLTLQDIITNDLPSADFAYLAACHSAAQDRTLPDEGLTLAGGMQFAGFKSVVGTMWAMADVDAPTWAEEFYKGLAVKSGEGKPFDCTKAAESLHDAVKELRRQKVPLFRRINLVHYGI